MKIVIIDYGAGNVFSVRMAVKRLGHDAVVSAEEKVIRTADRVIFPGVGQASAAMKRLEESGLDRIIPYLQMPVLGICLGMQLMCVSTEEEATKGLGIFPVTVKRITGDHKIPHIGWNNIRDLKSDLFTGIREEERMYFIHSYYTPDNPYCIARSDYHESFAVAIRKDNFCGCQFHPEKSSAPGALLLYNFLNLGLKYNI